MFYCSMFFGSWDSKREQQLFKRAEPTVWYTC